jgi:hypothetical protein
MPRASKIARQMRQQNRLNAEPAMQSAARQVGAELLPVLPEEVVDCDMPHWPIPPGHDCIKWNPAYSPFAKLLDASGSVHNALPIETRDWYYARLARRGDDLFVLVPKVTRRQVDKADQCQCDGMPRVQPPGAPRVVFVVEGTPKTPAQEIEVPVTEDYVNFQCRVYLM